MKNVIYENKSEPCSVHMQYILAATPHLHKEIEIIYVADGSAVAYADRNSSKISAGDFFICFPNQIHYYENSLPGKYYVMILSADIFFELRSKLMSYIPEKNSTTVKNHPELFKYIKAAIEYEGDYANTVKIGNMNLLLGALMPRLKLQPRLQSDNSTLKSIMNYCIEHFNNDEITLDTVAEDLHLSKYYVSKLLNRKINLSFNNYINTLRINKACDLLADTDKKIADISEDVGFGTIRSFNRAFQNIMNMTPIQYRNSQINQASDLR